MPDTMSFWNERGAHGYETKPWRSATARSFRGVSSPNLRTLTLSRGKENFEIATKIAYRNGGLIGAPRDGNKECSTVATAPVLPVKYVVNASWIAHRRVVLAGYRLADLLTRLTQK